MATAVGNRAKETCARPENLGSFDVLPHVPGSIFLLNSELERRVSSMQQLGGESRDDGIEIRGIPNDKLNDILQWIVALGFRVESLLVALGLLKDRHLKDDISSKFGGFKLKAIVELDSDDGNP
jgi:hypothetical protein